MPAIEIMRVMKFHSDAVDDDKLEVAGIKGDEGISRPYRFVLDLASKDKEIDLAKLIEEKAHLSIKQGITESGADSRAATTVKIHGVVSDVEQLGKQNDWIYYRAVLAPRLWKLTLSHNTRIFQDKKIPDLVKEICDEYEVKVDLDKLSGDYKTREYIVQYEESDFDFVQRWLEHEGIFYYFTQDDEEEVMVLGDAAEAYGTLVGDTEFDFNPQMGGNEDGGRGGSLSNDWLKKEVVSTLGCTHKQLPKEVVLNDYNWRTPADKLDVTAKVSDKGIGTVYEYNNHYSDKDEGKKLAGIRAEEINCREMEFRGRSDARGFRAGMVFKLKPPDGSNKEKLGLKDAFYQEYLLVEVHHKATQALDLDGTEDTGASYSNQFLAIPKSKVFRPHCGTAWPSIKGVMHAVIDGEDGSTPYAQIDDKGRYKVRFPFDMGDAGDGNATRWVRKSEAYAGPSQGMHFPLLKGAEVLIVFIDGDPDRPIISGAVFNEQNTSVVHQHNHTTNQIITPIGNTLTIDDTQGAPQIIMYTEAEKNKIVFDGTSGSEKITIKCDVSNSKIRFGKSDGEPTPEKVTNADGIYITADGDLNMVSGANTKMNAGALFEQAVAGDANIHIVGKKDEKVDGNSTAKTLGVTDDIMIGDYKVVNLAAKVALSAGATATAQVGAEAKIAYALSASCTRGDGISATWGASLKYDKSKSFTIGSDVWGLFIKNKIEQKALTEIKLDSAGKVVVSAGTQLMLRCGKSTITMTPAKIVIGSPQIVIGANAKIEVSSKGKIDVKASGPLTTKGAVVKDN